MPTFNQCLLDSLARIARALEEANKRIAAADAMMARLTKAQEDFIELRKAAMVLGKDPSKMS